VSQVSRQIGAAEAAASPPAAAGATAAAPGATPTTVPLLSGSASTPAKAAETTMSTPQRLRLLSLGVVVVGLVIGVIGALIFTYLAVSLSRAKADTAQLIRVQKIQSNLLSADATATNAFLVGGLEPPAQRAAYDQAMSSTSSLIAEAAQAQRADGTALAALNQQVLGYAAMIEQARANNRQGLPVGAQYLRNASAQLRSEALPVLDNLVSANAARAADEMTVGAGYVVLVLTLLALGGVIAAQIWLARRFKRKINVGMLAGSIVLFVLAVVSLIVVVQLHSALNQISSGSLAAVNTAADARIDANDAKSNESLTLIARGSGQAFEAAWKSSANSVTESVGRLTDKPELVSQWQAYTDVHTQIRALDDGGQWDKAVAKATGSASDSSNTAFGAFDSNLAGYLDSVSQDASDSLAAEQPGMVVAAILFLLGGVAAALLGRRGVTERLREYR
jgi:Ca2+/Na+ antiporter